jgi:hypothetical protein
VNENEQNPFEETKQEPIPEEIPRKTVGVNGNLLNVGGTFEGAGRPPGKKNRATVLNQFMGVKFKRAHPITGVEEERTVEEWLELAMISKAMMESDVPAYKEIKDTRFGKNTDNVNLTGDVDLTKAININIVFTPPTDELPDK